MRPRVAGSASCSRVLWLTEHPRAILPVGAAFVIALAVLGAALFGPQEGWQERGYVRPRAAGQVLLIQLRATLFLYGFVSLGFASVVTVLVATRAAQHSAAVAATVSTAARLRARLIGGAGRGGVVNELMRPILATQAPAPLDLVAILTELGDRGERSAALAVAADHAGGERGVVEGRPRRGGRRRCGGPSRRRGTGEWRATAISSRPRRVVATSRGARRAVAARRIAATTPSTRLAAGTPPAGTGRPRAVLSWIGEATMLG